MLLGSKRARIAVTAMLSVLMLLAMASSAFAAPPEPTLGMSALQDKLEASTSGTVQGYLKTVVRGSLIETIPLEIVGVTGDSLSSLIMFRAYGPKIETYGGIASGMSGSPIYVEDEGVDKVVGALSYGDAFTLGGAGLATPIDAMLQLVTDYSTRIRTLSEPVMLSGRLIDRVVVASDPEKFSAASASGAFVARPLASAFIGGLRPGTAAYERLADGLEDRGIALVGRGTSLSAGSSTFSTPLVPGAAMGALSARGDMWIGGLGTVTYVDEDEVLAFGHPAYWTGRSSLYMTNAWITGVWGSQATPYKVGYPAVVQGTVTQDRNAGVMGVVGDAPAETPVTAEVRRTDNGQVNESSVWLSAGMLDSGELADSVGSAASVAAYGLFDSYSIPGSAHTTTTIVVSDGETERTVRITNTFDNEMDIAYAMSGDIDRTIYSLFELLADGVEQPHIVSVDLVADVTEERSFARIVGVEALAPLEYGDNAVRVSLLAYGLSATQTVDAVVTIPDEAPLTGRLVASSMTGNAFPDEEDAPASGSGARPTMAGIVADLNESRSNNQMTVTFVPSDDEGGFSPAEFDAEEDEDEEEAAIETTASTPWVLSGSAAAEVTVIDASADTFTFGDPAFVSGTITGPTEDVEVLVYSVPEDGGEGVLLASTEAESVDGELYFGVPIDDLIATTLLRIVVAGGDTYTPAETYVVAQIRARLRFSASSRTVWRGSWVLLKASVSPRAATGSVKFQYYDTRAKKWRTLATKRLSHATPTTRASYWWRPGRGTWKLRAVYGGGDGVAGATTSGVTVRVR